MHKSMKTTMIYVTHDQVEAMTMADKIVVLQAGVIEQVGTPLELYHTPGNVFVAGFIGSPKMNIFSGSEAEKLGAHTAGVRPEHIDIDLSDGTWKGTVGVAEHLGSDTFVHVHDTVLGDLVTVRVALSNLFSHKLFVDMVLSPTFKTSRSNGIKYINVCRELEFLLETKYQ